MQITESLILLCWLVFFVVWVVSAFSAKRYVRRGSWGILIRFIIAIIVIALLQSSAIRNFFLQGQLALNPALQWLGVILCACGIAFAIWARMNLGTNWGMPMSLKENAELVTTGPYAYVRHPIYTGMILAMVGTSLVIIWWVVSLVAFFIYFVYAARTEEKIMLNEFPATYSDYMKRSKMLIPFVF